MTKEKLEEAKSNYVSSLKSFIIDNGGLVPLITIFGDLKKPNPEDEGKPAIIHVPIPDRFMESEEGKEVFIDKVLPNLSVEVKKNFIPAAVAWASEAWVRKCEEGVTEAPDNWKDMPVEQEVVIFTMESKYGCSTYIYEIDRSSPPKVNEDGELVNGIDLTLISEDNDSQMQGRFTGLFKIFED